MRWHPAAVVIVFGTAVVLFAVWGYWPQAILFALIALTNVAHLILNPATQPKSVVRSLEASRRVVASGG